MESKRWHIELYLTEDGRTTRAEAVLRTSAGTELRHSGVARRNPDDRDVPEIGDEVAAARALHDLADALLATAAGDISAVEKRPPVHLGFDAPAGAGR